MCEDVNDILFCSCEQIEQLSAKLIFPGRLRKKFFENEYLRTRMIWELHKFKGRFESDEVGKIAMPRIQLENGLTTHCILSLLNSDKEVFDFDYTPSEDDMLYIRSDYLYKDINRKKRPGQYNYEYMSFIVKNKRWSEGYHNPFITRVEQFAQGVIDETNPEKSK